MSEQQQTPLTYERILELFHENREQFRETDLRIAQMFRDADQRMDRMSQEADLRKREADRRMQELDRQIKRTSKQVGGLTSSIGAMIENMVAGNIVKKFQALGYEILQCARNVKYEYKKLRIRGEIDLFLENGDLAILIEVKTTLETADVRKHIRQLEDYRQCADARGDKRRFIGTVAGAVVEGEAEDFAHANGMYVIVQSGKAMEIITPPEGFQVKKW